MRDDVYAVADCGAERSDRQCAEPTQKVFSALYGILNEHRAEKPSWSARWRFLGMPIATFILFLY